MLPANRRATWLPNVFDDIFGTDWWSETLNSAMTSTRPAVNIAENETEYRVELAAPGLNKKDFKIDLSKNVLTVSSEKEENHEENNDGYMRKEFSYSSFKRSFTLPDTVNGEKIKAEHDNGILTIHIPKKPEAVEKGPRQISIS
ncbi:MAG: Hsp20/alpha crystallin family protein [Bacteroidales bacterium]|nr:Hsp20/alpha crystallin family protein [Bacteroidales bacterium]